jgi:hypothetical protein
MNPSNPPPESKIPPPLPPKDATSASPPSNPVSGTFADPAGFKSIPSPLAPIWPKGGAARYRPKLRPR